jgi:SAM-dependent methyltransferase
MDEQARRERELRDREAPTYEERFSAYPNRCEEQDLRRFLASRRWERVLDLGCGTQRFVDVLRETGTTAIGLDVSFESLRRGVQRSHGVYVLVAGSCSYLPFGAQAFDAVFSVQVLEHFVESTQRQDLFREVDRVLAPGGSAYFSSYALHIFDRVLGRESHRTGDHQFERLSPRRLRAELAQAFPGSLVQSWGQCLFLRCGTRPLQRLPSGIEDALRFSRPGGSAASISVARVEKAAL